MKFSLSDAFDPPAPIVPVRVRGPEGTDVAEMDAKIDTGGDLSAVPEHHVTSLDLVPGRVVRAAGFLGGPEEVVLFRADIEIVGVRLPFVEVLATRRPYAILGRNVLRHLVVVVDGPAGVFEIRASGTAKRRKG